MNVNKDGFKNRQLHIEDYLQMVSAEQREYAEVFAHPRIAENIDIITDFKRTIIWKRFYTKIILTRFSRK